MATLFDVNHLRCVNHRPHVFVLFSSLRKTQQTVKAGHDIGIDLNLRNKLLHTQYQVAEEFGLKAQNLIFGTKDLLFVLLQFLCDITLCLSQRLLAHPLLWHQILIGVTHFEVVAEDIVIADFQ